MRTEKAYLQDMVEALGELAVFVEGVDDFMFQQNLVLRKAVLMQLLIVGEAANHIGPALRSKYPAIPWVDIVGFRNHTVHGYFQLDFFRNLLRSPISSLRCSTYYSYACASRLDLRLLATVSKEVY